MAIAAPSDVPLPVTDLADEAPESREATLAKGLREHATMAFDLVSGPLYRFKLFRVGSDEHVMSLAFHHIVTDGWSTSLLLRQLPDAYAAALTGTEPSSTKPADSAHTVRYVEFAAAQRAALDNGDLEEQLQYWQQQLAGAVPLDMPTDRPRPAEPSFTGTSVAADLPADLVKAVRVLVDREGVSPFTVLSAALIVVLSRYSGHDDICLGTAALGRTDPDLEQVVGYFTNMVVLRATLQDDPTFTELVGRLSDTVLDAYDNQDVPFERVVDRLSPHRDPGRNPLFGVCAQFLTEHTAGTVLGLPGMTAEAIEAPSLGARFDLALTFVESPDRLRVFVEYALDIFDGWRINALVRHLTQVLSAACAQPDRPVSELPLLDEAEIRELLAAGTGEMLVHADEPVHVAISRRAREQPDHVAVVHGKDSLTYHELDRRAFEVAAFLRNRGVGDGQVVAVAVERDLDALVTLLGVLKAGAAFAVLDPSHPAGRLEYIIRDTAATVVMTQSRVRDRIPEAGAWSIVEVDKDRQAFAEAGAAAKPWATAGRDSLAYVLYTSGSTGQPKGVLIEHRALQSFIASYRRIFDLQPDDRMLQLAALTFDMSQGEIFAGLTAGASLVLVDKETGLSPAGLATLMRQERVTYICMSPAMLALVDGGSYPDLRKIMAGGEAVPAEMVAKWNLPGRRLINCYGPTEAAVGCTSYECPHEPARGAPPIGKPFTDRRMYVVDKADRLVPRGVPGELLIGGEEGLARGYLNQPELTARAFVEDPFHLGGRVYRSGGFVRWNRHFELEFLGRADGQVKLRGLRIELEEIESSLMSHPDVGVAAVTLRPDRRGEGRLVGYAAPRVGRRLDATELRAHLAERLPEYMIPTAWVFLDELPLTTARKVDRKALPEPVDADPEMDYVAPEGNTETAVARIYAEVLEVDRVSAAVAFFAAGGNSLQAMRVVSRLAKEFGVKLRMRAMFADATVRSIATEVDRLVLAKAAKATEGTVGGR
ncbi:non-ribosomal peptide synthetase [Micromonospora craniellae]|uniref:Amino acid adenylation domain-containing protein n=1 Tax=Micromonospora craniellae TaxID=2294034 RepID=A0A372FR81_9ACTN|nr:non-ribosomal peptide synthetase [Micromonospora craniellae]QOC93201.1 amino acid adenylation domain-containing protein [Micromonospora craniellae]RFS41008.1 amino acid adenylation domain-containing protein [Micromonospora craniellae]